MRIGFPGLGSRLRQARGAIGLTQEAVAESIGMSWMTVHRWEHDQRTISENNLKRLSQLYGKTPRWFLTLDEAGLDPPSARNDVAWRIFQRVADAPEKYHAMLERVVDDIVEGLEAGEGAGLDKG